MLALALMLAAAPVAGRSEQAREAPATLAPDPVSDRLIALDPRWAVRFASAPAAPAGFDQAIGYVPLKSGELAAVDLDEGRIVWTASLAVDHTPATGDGLVFAADARQLVAFDQRTGQPQWRAPLDAPLAGPLAWESGLVLASTAAGDLLAWRGQDGKGLWKAPLGSPLGAPPALAGARVYAALADGRLVGVDADHGTLVWSRPIGQATGLLALDDQLLAGTRDDRLHSLALDSGRTRWSQRAGADVAGAPAADESHIYFAALDNLVRALHRGSGNLAWRQSLPSRPAGGPLRAGQLVLVPLVTTDIGAFNAETGAPAFAIRAVGELGGVPFLRDQPRPTAPRLVVMSRDGALQGFAPRFEPPIGPLIAIR